MVKKLTGIFFVVLFLGVLFMHFVNLFLPVEYEQEIKYACREFGVEKELVYALVKTESNFDKAALSNKGAKGLMQIKDETALWCAEKMGLETFNSEKIYDPETNIRIGVWYISYLIDETGSEDLAIIAYNAGINRVKEWQRDGLVSEEIGEENKIPYPETKKYLKKVKYYKELYSYRLGNK